MGDGDRMFRIYAHRGLHGGDKSAENGLDAFAAAAAATYGVETDLRTDADGRLILFHDRTIQDVAVDSAPVAELERLAGRRIVTLDALLAAGLDTPLNLEVKTRKAAARLQAYRGRLPPDTWISSFVHPVAASLSDELSLPGGLLLASAPMVLPSPFDGVTRLVWDYNVIDDEVIGRGTELGWAQWVYGARTPAEHDRVRALGCAGVITDWPVLAER